MTAVLRTPSDLKKWRKSISGSVGFVPTMGALHRGHEELLKRARAENDFVVLSIFVNPTQFNDPKDFEKYPITWESDLDLAQKNGVQAIFAPQREDLYPDQYQYRVNEFEFSHFLDGAHRPGHFEGVLTVVMKLFQIVNPQRAYFGEKDFQQLRLIEGMVESFFMDLKIVPVATLREADGLAMSSRNARLTPAQREQAPQIYKFLTTSKTAEEARTRLQSAGFRVDYVEDLGSRRFAAAFLGEVRLIDNVAL